MKCTTIVKKIGKASTNECYNIELKVVFHLKYIS